MSNSNKKQLKATSQKLKDSIENQIGDFKNKVDKYGKASLWVGGGILAVYLLSKAFSDDSEELEEGEPKKKKKKRVEKLESAKPNFLTDTLKQEAIVFGLGLAAGQLRSFLQNLNNNDPEEDSK